ncbi:hypothetical protein HG535_0E03680 [Zygotorulaspora mrakii]|uniref:SWR1-complex protein 4 n=1 Tax=Zygotorulaspora mrakii TaxID=42260 RepID=A0A7H9B4J5_ZYGMR|nr:uncharacterized protein HG535_0E03680 [Zygotorulaspora mrakii]QLG73284.1 hypothetical protein HG535_0E03680 [Zygotorulaspora mrakii]
MSSSDIFDVLNIQQRSKSPGSTGSPTPSATVPIAGSKVAKPQVTGMQRELYNLLGENQPPVVVQSTNKFKEKLASISKPSPWTNASFRANKYVTLHHWVKGSKELSNQDQENQFSKFDVKLTIPEITKEDFDSFMKTRNENEKSLKDSQSTKEKSDQKEANNVDKDENTWSFEEVDGLFDLCRRYDMRWFVIHDRYSYGKPRSLEDLKEKFYEVCKHYFSNKDPNNALLPTLNFPKRKELERKKYLQRLLARSAAEIAEEEALIIESRKFEMAAKKTLNERESLLRLLDSPNSDQPVSQYLTSQGMSQLYGSLLSDKSRKRKHNPNIPENPWMKQQQQFAQQRQQLQQMQEKKQDRKHENQEVGSPRKTKKQKLELQTAMKRKAESVYAEHLLNKFNSEQREALGVISHGEKLPPGVYLRSTRISTFKPALQNKVLAALQELGLPTRPVMPTYKVVQKHDELLRQIANLIELKKHLDKLEAEKAISN